MYKIDFNNPSHIHFMGIGGISMSGFAELLHTAGFTITGSDTQQSKITQHLESQGISILYGQRASNITDNIDLVVYTAAIQKDNPEYQEAVKRNLPMIERSKMVGQVMGNYQYPFSISGTHGKTTTTSMLSHIFLQANLDPTISVGGILKEINGNLRIGESEYFITEACEYTNSFLDFKPKYSIILNIEEDHMDFFQDIEDIRNSFQSFCKIHPSDGVIALNGEIFDMNRFIEASPCRIVTYHTEEGNFDYIAKNIQYDEFGFGSYDLYHRETFLEQIKLQVVGLHNISNSLAAISLSLEVGIPLEEIKKGIHSFRGTQRRFEYKGKLGDIVVIDDYAHHPTEIEATLHSCLRLPHDEIWCVFQPHTYTRTKAFLKDFAKALSLADHIVLTDIYAAREKDPGDISSKDLVKELQALHKPVFHFSSFGEIEDHLLTSCKKNDLLITMGAGDVVKIGESLLGR